GHNKPPVYSSSAWGEESGGRFSAAKLGSARRRDKDRRVARDHPQRMAEGGKCQGRERQHRGGRGARGGGRSRVRFGLGRDQVDYSEQQRCQRFTCLEVGFVL